MADDYPIFDETVFSSMKSDVGEDVALMLLGSLKQEIQKGVDSIKQHYADKDYHLLENQAHALKSAVRSFGAIKLGEACLSLEKAGKERQPLEEIAELLEHFESAAQETLSAFNF